MVSANEKMRYYYVDRNQRKVYISNKQCETELGYLGCTMNPRPVMAVSVFLGDEVGFSLAYGEPPKAAPLC